jgi:hypothetical protein
MMTIEEKLKMYREKRQFIYDVSMAFIKNPKSHSVDDIIYEVLFKVNDLGEHFSEWITIRYEGGAKAHRCVSCNSNSANFKNIAEMIDGGYYGENEHYIALIGKDWKKLDLNKMCGLHEVK